MICWGVITPLIEQCAVVVACNGGFIRTAGSEICPCRKAEVCAAVEHIKIEVCVNIKKILNLFGYVGGISRVVLITPMVKPAAPELAAHIRAVILEIF